MLEITFVGSKREALRDFTRLALIVDPADIAAVASTQNDWLLVVRIPIDELGDCQAWLSTRDDKLRVAEIVRDSCTVRLASGLPIPANKRLAMDANFLELFDDVHNRVRANQVLATPTAIAEDRFEEARARMRFEV